MPPDQKVNKAEELAYPSIRICLGVAEMSNSLAFYFEIVKMFYIIGPGVTFSFSFFFM
jgi:hypothetical protein